MKTLSFKSEPIELFTRNGLELILSLSTPRYKVTEHIAGKVVIKIPLDRILYVMDYLNYRKPMNLEISYSPLKWYECRIFPYQYKTIHEPSRVQA